AVVPQFLQGIGGRLADDLGGCLRRPIRVQIAQTDQAECNRSGSQRQAQRHVHSDPPLQLGLQAGSTIPCTGGSSVKGAPGSSPWSGEAVLPPRFVAPRLSP